MQSNGPRAVSGQKSNFAVSPETKVVPPTIRHLFRRQIFKLCFVLLALAISGATARVAQGVGTLSFSPTWADMGNVAVGSSRSITVTVKNTGTTSATISAESVHAGEFGTSGLTIPTTIAAGGSTTLTVKFSPTHTGLTAGYIQITSNASNSSVQYEANGTGVISGTLAATPSSVNFGSVPIGSKNTQTVQVKNIGAAALTISKDTLVGTGYTVSGLASPLSLTLLAGQTASITVAYAPTSAGSVTGSLVLGSNATNSALTIALSGTGVTATRTISLGTTSLNFGNEVVGGTSALAVAVKNTGNSSVTVTQVNVSGNGYSASGGLAGATIAAGQTAELNVMFAPKATGSVSGTVSIVSNASNTPSAIAVSGAGVSSTAHSVSLNWAASSSSSVIGYYVYRSTTSGGGYTRLTSAAVNALKYTDGAVSAGDTYYYVVTTVTSSGVQSGYSGQVIATIP
jgi:Abnormal spindle-like microcephaly-assoc'd, ASPM-SPD-2-Hydin